MKLYKTTIISVTTENGITKTVIEKSEKEYTSVSLELIVRRCKGTNNRRDNRIEIGLINFILNVRKDFQIDYINEVEKLQSEGWEEIEV